MALSGMEGHLEGRLADAGLRIAAVIWPEMTSDYAP
jgi:hypothetical protein